MSRGHAQDTFVVPGTGPNPAPEIIYCKAEPLVAPISEGQMDLVDAYQVTIETLVATALTKVEFLRAGGDVTVDADWNEIDSETTAGVKAKKEVVGQRVRMRVLSGGTSGNHVASIHWRGGKD